MVESTGWAAACLGRPRKYHSAQYSRHKTSDMRSVVDAGNEKTEDKAGGCKTRSAALSARSFDLPMLHAADTPKTRLSGTAIKAIVSVMMLREGWRVETPALRVDRVVRGCTPAPGA